MNSNQLIFWLAAEILKITLQRLDANGQLKDLTEESAQALVKQFTDSLPIIVRSPEDLEQNG